MLEYIGTPEEANFIKLRLEAYERIDNQSDDCEMATRFIIENCMDIDRENAYRIIKLYVINHFRLDRKSASALKKFWDEKHEIESGISYTKNELKLSINREIEGISHEISLKMTYDNRKGFVENVWVNELLIDGKQISVPVHTYDEHIIESTKDYTAVARDFVNITRSEKIAHDLTTFLVYATHLPDEQASEIINDLMELAKSRAEEIARLDPKTNAEFERISTKENNIATDVDERISKFLDTSNESLFVNVNSDDIDEQDGVRVLLRNYTLSNNISKNIDLAKQFIRNHYADAPKADVIQVIEMYVKPYFRLDNKGVSFIKQSWNDIQKERRDAKKADEVKKREAKLSVDEDEAIEARRIAEETRAQNITIREKREKRISDLYDILKNKSGNSTVADIEAAKSEIKEKMMDTFWTIEGFNEKTGNMGHLSLKKLAIADYIQKAFNMVRFGGRIWWFDWNKSFYTYDSDDVLIHQEIVSIMNIVGDGDLYRYNGNVISDKAQIIDAASNVKVFTENPFNKYTGYINARNGVLKLDYENKSVTQLGKRPEFMFSYCIDTEYKPKAIDSEIHSMLGQNLGEVQRDLFYQMAAIAIRDTDPKLIPSKIAYLFIGPRNTGKNVVMSVLDDFFGKAIVSRIPLIEIAENKFVKPLLEGKVINLDDELPEHLPLTESREIKSLTGGKFHTLEPKNVKPYSGIITALMVFAGNQFPKCNISRNDSAFWDRWEIFNFDKEQHKVDENYLNKLLTLDNLSGFFNRVIDHLFFIHDNPIKRKQGLYDTYDEWLHSASTVYRFYYDMTIKVDERMEYPKDEFFKYYHDWCEAVNIPIENRAANLQEFGRELAQTCHVKEGRMGTGERQYTYRMFRRYESGQLAYSLMKEEPTMHVSMPDDDEMEIPEEVWTIDEDGFPVKEYIYKK
jgi:phage/plasmid-associated DNA primase